MSRTMSTHRLDPAGKIIRFLVSVPDDFVHRFVPRWKLADGYDEDRRARDWIGSAEWCFADNVDWSGGTDVCWPWTGDRNKQGYGILFFDRRHRLAPRLMWEATYGPIPERSVKGELFVCHRCDWPPCVNPLHLFLDTAAGNVRDMLAKGRASWQRVDRRPGDGRTTAPVLG